ncbi:MAG: 4-(cytidine 5'-diphospho)-2-C-methyl-D-erythritol kinase [Candidatus Omnitrophica bacterium]|nr:4-(cytidine 5'-diphospho)-2-C-methyl-D-erythritol kinase [Candidatus Omnitrophota bacterium]
MRFLVLQSPAKINLTLHVTGKLPGGYHALDTLFHRISLCDRLKLTRTPRGFDLRTDAADLPTDERNLITQAYRLLEIKFPKLGGVRVELQKKIPLGAGLGGGSSNAAFFLLGMNRLYELGLTRRTLMGLGRQLGADVPFFLYEANQARGSHRGDVLKVRPASRPWFFILVLDSKELRTKEVFGKFGSMLRPDSLTKGGRTARMLSTFLDRGNLSAVTPLLHNDLERSAFVLRPELERRVSRLNQAGLAGVRMSGSGPTLFAMFSQRRDQKRYLRVVRGLFPALRIEEARTF